MASNKTRFKTTNGIDGNNLTITNVANPVNAQDVATKATVDLKANLASPTFTGTVSGITKAMVGLSNADDTSDASKNVLSATKLATARTIGMTGDVSYTSASFDGSGNVTGTATLSNSGVTAGTYNTATKITPFTVDAKGRVTAAGTAITIGDGGNNSIKIGNLALLVNTTGSYNTAIGGSTLYLNTTGSYNTAIGYQALYVNTTGLNNTANGVSALLSNTTGVGNTANGVSALSGNTIGSYNAANGGSALSSNTIGSYNAANGYWALSTNSTGNYNTANGYQALYTNSTGSSNTANGASALALLNPTQIGIASVSDYSATIAGTVKITTNFAHNYTTGQSRSIRGTTSYDGTYSITVIDALSFYITKAFVATSTGFVYDNSQATNNTAIGSNSGTDAVANLTTQSNYVVIGNNSTTNANIKVAWTVTSDARDKTNFKPIKHGLEFVNQLKPTEYQYRKDRFTDEVQTDSRPRYGFLAQDILPLEGSNPIIIDDRDVENLKFNESSLIPVLVKAVQELSTQLTELKTLLGV